ncbi:MAG: beta-ketoacyl-[acyl-carrier-protein] synthase family protein [Verrucomicrobiaceae bacterium]|nr:beta-ketoacyl-[acyl-carrier-protein] synthase family protein [Verrucomicrobiaceae bacterium]
MKKAGEKIVITGSGIVCGAGASVAEVWERLEKGETAVAPFTRFDGTKWPVKVAAEVQQDNRFLVSDRKLHKTISRTDMFGIYAAEKALDDSGIPQHREELGAAETEVFNDRTGLIVGTGGGNYHSNYDFLPLMTEAKAAPEGEMVHFGRELGNQVTPMWLLKNLPNNVLCHVGIRGDYKGTNACITNQCVSGVLAVAEGAAAIWNDEADRIAAAGHDAPFEPEMVYYYHRLGLMSGEAPRPFDAARDGTVFGEGAAAVVLERESNARARGAKVLGEFLGFGCCGEASGILDLEPDGDGVKRAIEAALADAGITADQVGFICAHGNGNEASDASESRGIRGVFGENIPPVTAFKWAYGHLIAASGIADLVMVLEALKRGLIPGIATLGEVDLRISPFPISRQATAPRGDVALLICRGFGGMNVVLVVRGVS